MPRKPAPQYLNPHQTRLHEPSDAELALAAAIEAAFVDGVTTLEGLIDVLNRQGVHDLEGNPWTEATFTATMQRLGA